MPKNDNFNVNDPQLPLHKAIFMSIIILHMQKGKPKIIVSLIGNIALFAMVFVSMVGLLSGYGISENSSISYGIAVFKYFTIDSNVLIGVIALLYAIFDILFLLGKKEELPHWLSILKLLGTVGVVLTGLTVILFLVPVSVSNGNSFFALYTSWNFFFHFLIPLVSLIVFLFFENTKELVLRDTFIALIPMLAYTVYYMTAALTHVENGRVTQGYDWYGFVAAGASFAPIPILAMIAATYAISFLLYFGNKKMAK